MEQLREFLKGMSRAEQVAFAEACGTTIGYIRKMLSLGRPLGADTCVAIERESRRIVTRKHLRPGDWHRYWPELVAVGARTAPHQEVA
ncbi:Cro/Cl family transcriptional regulator [Burkholderia sp. Bp9031]|uniref:transcriptional regulator n=1 Tax=Burkholderia sp. Bp9031 TaxID=2184566 RepID=UPI000F5DFC06|nr:YdaS family helix-turn-helix protein [Burkholderia sp. Bp9031]RQZ18119.1 Cro/Cl family transcriptional regulator [Burkholderia sp. Bp9031]